MRVCATTSSCRKLNCQFSTSFFKDETRTIQLTGLRELNTVQRCLIGKLNFVVEPSTFFVGQLEPKCIFIKFFFSSVILSASKLTCMEVAKTSAADILLQQLSFFRCEMSFCISLNTDTSISQHITYSSYLF